MATTGVGEGTTLWGCRNDLVRAWHVIRLSTGLTNKCTPQPVANPEDALMFVARSRLTHWRTAAIARRNYSHLSMEKRDYAVGAPRVDQRL
jgi:hypothetical protein